MLAGDAGGFVYPGTGEGIFYAMKSGRIAAETMADALERDMLDKETLNVNYTDRLKKAGLLALRDVDFIEKNLSSSDAAESYIKKLSLLAGR